MTAFLFIPSAADAAPYRRVDLTNFANLFVEAEPAPPARARHVDAMRFIGAVLFVLVAMGDTVMLVRPLAPLAAATQSTQQPDMVRKPALT